jgi:hypothetical protein
MSSDQPAPNDNPPSPAADASSAQSEFARQAEEAPPGILRELFDFLVYNKAWWLTPIIIVLLLVGVLVVLSSTAAAPFIYPLF